MYSLPEQVIDFNKSALNAALQFSEIALGATERLVNMQLVAARETFAKASQTLQPLFDGHLVVESQPVTSTVDKDTKAAPVTKKSKPTGRKQKSATRG